MKHRWLVVALALIAASAFALSVQAVGWWSIGNVEVGPFGTRSPFGGAGDISWAGSSARWERFRVATLTGALIAMFVLLVVAGAVAAKRIPKLAAKTALVAVATVTLAAIGFVMSRPDNNLPFALDRGLPLFVGAVLVAVLAAVAVLRVPLTPGEPGHASR